MGYVFRDCDVCPTMVVMPERRLALGRYEVTVGEYRAFAAATAGGAGGGCDASLFVTPDSWRDPGHPQTDRHPVTCVSWDDAQEYASWLSRETGAEYRLPSETEWTRAAAGSQPGCYFDRTDTRGTCPVGSYGSNPAGLSDMVSNVAEWTSDCWQGDCGRRVQRGNAWGSSASLQSADSRYGATATRRDPAGEELQEPRRGLGARVDDHLRQDDLPCPARRDRRLRGRRHQSVGRHSVTTSPPPASLSTKSSNRS